jgi:tRNA pseudouridine13 synthase
MSRFTLPIWPFAYGGPSGRGRIRTFPEDFIVDEMLAFEPSGAGEHAFLRIRKTGENTDYVARQLARFAGVRQRDIGFAGLKDRHAVTTQWFSVWLPGKADPDWSAFASASIEVLQAVRHARKLQRGALSGNRFTLTVSDWQGDRDQAEAQLNSIRSSGIPNYFGEQRFGHQGRNVEQALGLFQGKKAGREQRSLYLSAARSFLFNQMLAIRVEQRTWNRPLPGEILMFDKSHSRFKADASDPAIAARVEAGEIHPTGVLWGQGGSGAAEAVSVLEAQVIGRFSELAEGLLASGVEAERRALRVNVPDLAWGFSEGGLQLSFSLPAGSYATALLREVVDWND